MDNRDKAAETLAILRRHAPAREWKAAAFRQLLEWLAAGTYSPRKALNRTMRVGTYASEVNRLRLSDKERVAVGKALLDEFRQLVQEWPAAFEKLLPRGVTREEITARLRENFDGGWNMETDVMQEMAASGPADKDAAEDLELFIRNDQPTYRQLESAYKNLVTKLAQGKYQRDRAVDLFMFVVEAAAKRYMQDPKMKGPIDQFANKNTRRVVATALRDDFEELLRDGELDYKQWVPKKYADVDIVANLRESTSIVVQTESGWVRLIPLDEARRRPKAPVGSFKNTKRGQAKRGALLGLLKKSNRRRKTKIRDYEALAAHIGLQAAGRKGGRRRSRSR